MRRTRDWLRRLWISGPIIIRRRGTYLSDLARAYETGRDRGGRR